MTDCSPTELAHPSSLGPPVDASEHGKAMLDVSAQIAKLREKGVTFELCPEDEAMAYLTDRTYFFKLYSYRDLFERRMGGGRDGQYVKLDFGDLVELTSVDRTLRYTLLPLTLDIEHFARAKLIKEATSRTDEDGYSIVSDYIASLNHAERRRREGEVRAVGPDPYSGDLVRKYHLPDEMPLWVLLELISFGTFINLYRFCAKRWDDRSMLHEHYMLRQSKAVRNAAAHSSNVINGFARSDATTHPDAAVTRAITETGISRRVRTSKMKNARLQQITTLLYLHTQIVPEGTSKRRARSELSQLRDVLVKVRNDLSDNDAVRSSFDFLATLIDKWFVSEPQ